MPSKQQQQQNQSFSEVRTVVVSQAKSSEAKVLMEPKNKIDEIFNLIFVFVINLVVILSKLWQFLHIYIQNFVLNYFVSVLVRIWMLFRFI